MMLPPFPVDEQTLALLMQAIRPGPGAARSSLGEFCLLYSQLAGSDPTAVLEVTADGVAVMADPEYSPHDIIAALVGEIRRLRVLSAVSTGVSR